MAKKETKKVVVETMTATVIGGSLNIRAGKGTDTDVIGRLKDGAKVEILKKGKDWCQIDKGYVMTKYLSFE